jgi:D-alanyl-D-alanine carboxypeptidase
LPRISLGATALAMVVVAALPAASASAGTRLSPVGASPAGASSVGASSVGASSVGAVVTTSTSPAHVTPLRSAATRLIDEGAVGYTAQVFDGRRREVVAVGKADLATGRRLRSDARVEIGSNTKTFVATVVLQLVAEHRLSLSDPIEKWLPGVVPNGDGITVRMILNHTSGLYNYTADPDWVAVALADPERVWQPEELVAVAVRHAPTFPPATGWEYSNTNYILAGMILERVTGDSAAELIARRITGPLHLEHTYLPVGAAGTDGPRRAHAYMVLFAADGTRTYTDTGTSSLSWAGTAGAIISTPAELGRFFSALLGGRLLPPAQLAQMRSTVPTTWPGTDYGLGLARSQTPCGITWGHGGDTLGHHTLAAFSADGRRSAVAATTTQPDLGQDPSVPAFVTLFTDRERVDLQAICQMLGRPLPAAKPAAKPTAASRQAGRQADRWAGRQAGRWADR